MSKLKFLIGAYLTKCIFSPRLVLILGISTGIVVSSRFSSSSDFGGRPGDPAGLSSSDPKSAFLPGSSLSESDDMSPNTSSVGFCFERGLNSEG